MTPSLLAAVFLLLATSPVWPEKGSHPPVAGRSYGCFTKAGAFSAGVAFANDSTYWETDAGGQSQSERGTFAYDLATGDVSFETGALKGWLLLYDSTTDRRRLLDPAQQTLGRRGGALCKAR